MKKEDKIKSEVLEGLKGECGFENEDELNNRLKSYNAYDDANIIITIFNIVSDILDYDYINSSTDGWGMVTFWSVILQRSIILTQSDSFEYGTLDKIIERIKKYEVEAKKIETKIKKGAK